MRTRDEIGIDHPHRPQDLEDLPAFAIELAMERRAPAGNLVERVFCGQVRRNDQRRVYEGGLA